jgi:hypothetical protein
LDDALSSEALESDLERLGTALEAASRTGDGRRAARAALAIARQYAGLVQLDRDSTAGLRAQARRLGLAVRDVPERRGDVHDLDALAAIAARLFDSDVPTAGASVDGGGG